MNFTVLIVYLGFLVGFGIYQGMKAKNTTDYNMGGRDVPGWACALSERATAESAWCLVGFPGYAYASGLVSVWVAIGRQYFFVQFAKPLILSSVVAIVSAIASD